MSELNKVIESIDDHDWVEVISLPKYKSREEVVNKLKETAQVFKRFSLAQILENDTQYDIDSLEKWFKVAIKSIDKKYPSPNEFQNILAKICKPYDDRDYTSF